MQYRRLTGRAIKSDAPVAERGKCPWAANLLRDLVVGANNRRYLQLWSGAA